MLQYPHACEFSTKKIRWIVKCTQSDPLCMPKGEGGLCKYEPFCPNNFILASVNN